MLVLLQVVGLPAMSTAPSATFLISMILIIVAQAYRWLCSGWVLPVLWARVSSHRPACHIARRRKSPYSRHYGVSPLLHVAAPVIGVADWSATPMAKPGVLQGPATT